MYGLTKCKICNNLIQRGEDTIGIPPCVPDEVIQEAAELLPEGAISFKDDEEEFEMCSPFYLHLILIRLQTRDKASFPYRENWDAMKDAYPREFNSQEEWIEALDEFNKPWLEEANAILDASYRKFIAQSPEYRAMVRFKDHLFHKSCYENSPLKDAIDKMRGWLPHVFVVDTESTGIMSDDGKVEIITEQVIKGESK
jgi:hypothetical protein